MKSFLVLSFVFGLIQSICSQTDFLTLQYKDKTKLIYRQKREYEILLKPDTNKSFIISKLYQGTIEKIDNISITIIPYREETTQKSSDKIINVTNKTFMNDTITRVTINLNDILYFRYEPWTKILCVVIGTYSAASTLIVAPLVSYNFKSAQMNSERYTKVSGYSVFSTVVVYSLAIIIGHKTYWLSKPLKNKKRKIWTIKK